MGIKIKRHAGLILIPLLATGSACQSVGSFGGEPGYAARSTFRCGGGVVLRVERRSTSVVINGAGGEDILLPASPPGSQSRFGTPSHALVLEDHEALWMVAGEPPLACRR